MLNQHPENKPAKIDPDLLDVIVQSLSVLSNVATLAGTWVTLRQQFGRQRHDQIIEQVRSQLRELRRSLEDCFDAAEQVLRILQAAEARMGRDLLLARPRFGEGVLLEQEEFNHVTQHLGVWTMQH